MRMRSSSILSWAVLSLVCFGSLHADDPSEMIDGRWEWSDNIANAGVVESVLVLHSNGEELTGKYQNQTHSAEIEDGEIDGINVSFSITVEAEQGDIGAEFIGEFIDGNLEGEIVIDTPEDSLSIPWKPSRVTRSEEVLGSWEFEFTAPDGNTYKPTFEFTQEGDKLAGQGKAEGKEVEFSKVTLEGGKLMFGYTADYEGSDLVLKYVCYPRGHKLPGKCYYSINGEEGDFEVSGKKSVLDKRLQSLVGVWKCEVESPLGTFKPTLILAGKGGKLSGRIMTDEHAATIEEVVLRDGEATFSIHPELDVGKVSLIWKIGADGDKMSGVVQFKKDNVTGTIDVTGNRITDD